MSLEQVQELEKLKEPDVSLENFDNYLESKFLGRKFSAKEKEELYVLQSENLENSYHYERMKQLHDRALQLFDNSDFFYKKQLAEKNELSTKQKEVYENRINELVTTLSKYEELTVKQNNTIKEKTSQSSPIPKFSQN